MSYNKRVQTSKQGYFNIHALFERIEPTNGHPYSKTIGFYLCGWSEQSRARVSFYVGILAKRKDAMKTTRTDGPRRTPSPLKIAVIAVVAIMALLITASVVEAVNERNNEAQRVQLQKEAEEKVQKDQQAETEKANYEKCLSNANELGLKALNTDLTGVSYSEQLQHSQNVQSMVDSYKQDCDRYYGK